MEATWVGHNARNGEHLVALASGGLAIRVRTARPRPESERWSAKAIREILATPAMPNPRDVTQDEVKAERSTKGVDFGLPEGNKMSRGENMEPKVEHREFKITLDVLEAYGSRRGVKGSMLRRTTPRGGGATSSAGK